jgi:hypothetical protein
VAGEKHDYDHTMKQAKAATPEPTVQPTPQPTVAPRPTGTAPGNLKVTVAGGGWGTIYIDGKKIKQKAPMAKYAISVGTHTIKVENVALGLSYTETVQVTSGGSFSVTAK